MAFFGLMGLACLSSLLDLPDERGFFLLAAILIQVAIIERRIRKLAESMIKEG